MNPSPSGSDIKQFLRLLGEGERIFRMLHLEDLDGVNLNLRECDLQGSRLKEARLGHANLSNSLLNGCCFQQALLWGADLSRIKAINTFWQEADLSGCDLRETKLGQAQLTGTIFEGAIFPEDFMPSSS